MHATGTIGPNGPLFSFWVGASVERQQALRTAGRQPPPAQTVNLLIDTGASGTTIDQRIIAALGLTPTGTTLLHTPSTGETPVEALMYDVEIAIAGHPGAGVHALPSLAVVAADFSAQGIGGLAGRDLLAKGRFIYSGIDGFIMLSL